MVCWVAIWFCGGYFISTKEAAMKQKQKQKYSQHDDDDKGSRHNIEVTFPS